MKTTKSSLSEFEQSFLKNFTKGYIDSNLMYDYATFLHEKQEEKLASEALSQIETAPEDHDPEFMEEPKVTLAEAFETFREPVSSTNKLEEPYETDVIIKLPGEDLNKEEDYDGSLHSFSPADEDCVENEILLPHKQTLIEDMAAACYGDNFHDLHLASTCYNVPKRNRRLSSPVAVKKVAALKKCIPLIVPSYMTKLEKPRLSYDFKQNVSEEVLQELLPALAKIAHYWDFAILEDIFRSEDGAEHDMSRYMEGLDLGGFVHKIWQEQLIDNNYSAMVSRIPQKTREFIVDTLPSPRRYVAKSTWNKDSFGQFTWSIFIDEEQVALDTILRTFPTPDRNALFQIHCGFIKAVRKYGIPSMRDSSFVDASIIYMFHTPLLGIFSLTKDMVSDGFDWYGFGATIGKIYFSTYESSQSKDMMFILSHHYIQKNFPPITIFIKHLGNNLTKLMPQRQTYPSEQELDR